MSMLTHQTCAAIHCRVAQTFAAFIKGHDCGKPRRYHIKRHIRCGTWSVREPKALGSGQSMLKCGMFAAQALA